MLIYLGFPFETIYPQSLRSDLMARILSFFGNVTSAGEPESIPNEFRLFQNYPNPFNPSTSISYHLPARQAGLPAISFVTLKVFDILGREVAVLVNKMESPGRYVVSWDAGPYPSGVYFYRLESDGTVKTKKMTVLK